MSRLIVDRVDRQSHWLEVSFMTKEKSKAPINETKRRTDRESPFTNQTSNESAELSSRLSSFTSTVNPKAAAILHALLSMLLMEHWSVSFAIHRIAIRHFAYYYGQAVYVYLGRLLIMKMTCIF